MEILKSILQVLISISLFTGAFINYLTLNKLWPRKHEPEVASSFSVVAQIIGIASTIPFLLNSVLVLGDWKLAIQQLMTLALTTFFLFLGIGFWVKERRRLGLWQKFLKALKQESKESTNLIQALSQPSGKKQLLSMLYRLAWLDDKLDEKEKQYLQMFADNWEIDIQHLLQQPPPEKGLEKFNKIREEVISYLATKPSQEQALSLSDVVRTLVKIDQVVTREEELIAEEVCDILNNYAGQGKRAVYGLIIKPDPAQEPNLRKLVASLQEEYILGGCGFLVETYQTQAYAEALSEFYREQGFFTVIHKYAGEN